jgi:hypothetical protein
MGGGVNTPRWTWRGAPSPPATASTRSGARSRKGSSRRWACRWSPDGPSRRRKRRRARPVIVVSRTLASRLFPGENPIGAAHHARRAVEHHRGRGGRRPRPQHGRGAAPAGVPPHRPGRGEQRVAGGAHRGRPAGAAKAVREIVRAIDPPCPWS